MPTEYEMGNLGHRPRTKGGYFPVPPVDSAQDIRSEMLSTMAAMGVVTEKHHHEVASAQHELGIKFGPLTLMGDAMQIYKYVIHNVANSYGKTATFMPKPVFGDNGSGMHVHQSIWKGSEPVMAGNLYADLSEVCLFYIGGILKHAKALNAFTNPSTNSYKRLVPGYEAPVLRAYSSRNRSASCRIPVTSNPKAKRVEVRFPDPAANPYLAFAAMLMAGLDGVRNRIHPGDPIDKNLYDLPEAELREIPTVCGSLQEAIDSLDADRAFLKEGGVFTDDQIDAYVDLKVEEIDRFRMMPHPIEFDMYYSAKASGSGHRLRGGFAASFRFSISVDRAKDRLTSTGQGPGRSLQPSSSCRPDHRPVSFLPQRSPPGDLPEPSACRDSAAQGRRTGRRSRGSCGCAPDRPRSSSSPTSSSRLRALTFVMSPTTALSFVIASFRAAVSFCSPETVARIRSGASEVRLTV